jgi:opacity protein-like surface antigen
MKPRTFCASVATLALAAGPMAPAAHAQQAGTGLYLGGQVSFDQTGDLGSSIDAALADQGDRSRSTADSWSSNPGLRLGYQFSPNFALEGSYDRVGNLGLESALSAPAPDSAAGNWKSWGLGLHALGILPIGSKWSVYGRLGVEQWHTSLSLTSNAGGPTRLSGSDDNTSLALGAGVSYALTPHVDATAELTHYTRVGDTASTGSTGLNELSLGLRYHFP